MTPQEQVAKFLGTSRAKRDAWLGSESKNTEWTTLNDPILCITVREYEDGNVSQTWKVVSLYDNVVGIGDTLKEAVNDLLKSLTDRREFYRSEINLMDRDYKIWTESLRRLN